MKYDFDTIIDRKHTDSIKYDFARFGVPEDALPMWVADMDFMTPAPVVRALRKRARHGVFGYGETDERYFHALRRWFAGRFGWKVQEGWLVKTPGVVFAISAAVRAFTDEGDPVLIQQPVYYPFADCVHKNNRRLVVNELVYETGKYTIDFGAFESLIIRDNIKLFILCSPHNPVGRVWTKNELTRLGDICHRHGVIVVADEIHQDFVYGAGTHHVLANIKPIFANIAVTCTAPSKTFNLPGLQVANIWIQNGELREKFRAEVDRTGYGEPNVMGAVACRAAYEKGGPWLEELLPYLDENIMYLREFALMEMPAIRVVKPEGTYLAWLDCRALEMEDRELDEFMLHRAKLWLDGGHIFGAGGSGFQRINLACPRARLTEALDRLAEAVNQL